MSLHDLPGRARPVLGRQVLEGDLRGPGVQAGGGGGVLPGAGHQDAGQLGRAQHRAAGILLHGGLLPLLPLLVPVVVVGGGGVGGGGGGVGVPEGGDDVGVDAVVPEVEVPRPALARPEAVLPRESVLGGLQQGNMEFCLNGDLVPR